jgi:hypothetical protein
MKTKTNCIVNPEEIKPTPDQLKRSRQSIDSNWAGSVDLGFDVEMDVLDDLLFLFESASFLEGEGFGSLNFLFTAVYWDYELRRGY